MISVSAVHGGPSRLGVPDSRPLANTAFIVKKGNDTITSFTTDDQGGFRISLAAGHYTISRKDWEGRVGSYGPFEVDVAASQIRKIQWNCDTGMQMSMISRDAQQATDNPMASQATDREKPPAI